ncbi:MAG: nucleotide exchange factor GrpE [Magnetococcales bacterium]|nr:nucleotide exchange factor GrpE [Magnetococcales bacterium]
MKEESIGPVSEQFNEEQAEDEFDSNLETGEKQSNSLPIDSPPPEQDSDIDESASDNEQSLEDRIKLLEDELLQEKKQSQTYHDNYLRMVADMDNLRKRTAREKENSRKFALESFAKELLTLADNVERALNTIRNSGDENEDMTPLLKSLFEGVEMIEVELQRTLNNNGIEKIKAEQTTFNPNLHQAVTQEESHEAESGTVLKELQTGYTLNGRLLRPTMVTVAK